MDQKLGSERQSCVFQLKEKRGNIGLFISKRICLRQSWYKFEIINMRLPNEQIQTSPVNIDETLNEVRKKEIHPNVYSGSDFFFLINPIFLCFRVV